MSIYTFILAKVNTYIAIDFTAYVHILFSLPFQPPAILPIFFNHTFCAVYKFLTTTTHEIVMLCRRLYRRKWWIPQQTGLEKFITHLHRCVNSSQLFEWGRDVYIGQNTHCRSACSLLFPQHNLNVILKHCVLTAHTS